MERQNLRNVLERLKAAAIGPDEAKRMLSAARAGDAADKPQPGPAAAAPRDAEPIAVVGMSGRYPGSPDLDAYWSLLARGEDAVKEIPPARWNVGEYFDAEPGKPGAMYCKWLGALDDVDSFDSLFFRIPPSEAEFIDPQHRLFLEEAYRAFEDAGIAPGRLGGRACGVYLGIMSNEYNLLLARNAPDSGHAVANHFSIGAARIAYHLDLKGPAIPVDTACSSSLVAAHLACQALRAGEIDVALVGGVTLYLSPDAYIGMCAAGMLSPDGRCKTFDQRANGFVPGEGVGALVLKRLADARAHGDPIHGVIVGSGVNQDGRSNGMTAPNGASQTALERAVYERYGVDPDSFQYAELHGTGTKLGDPIELAALADAFRAYTGRRGFCAIGSVKTNVGHTSAAAGVASVQKVLLSMRHGQIAPSLHFREPNEHFDFAASPFYVSTALAPWPTPEHGPRRACVSAFGFSGTNAHMVLQADEPPSAGAAAPGAPAGGAPHLFVFSARTEPQLDALLDTYVAFLRRTRVAPESVAYTLQTGRDAMACRLAVRASSLAALADVLEQVRALACPDGVWRGRGAHREPAEKIDAALRARDLDTLGECWANGQTVDWAALYPHARPTRAHLPTYRFAPARHWFQAAPATPPDAAAVTAVTAVTAAVVAAADDAAATPFEQRASIPADAPCFVDHVIDGERVLPGSAYLELVRAALADARREPASGCLVLSDVRWRRTLQAGGGVRLRVVLSARGAPAAWKVVSADDGAIVYCSGSAQWEALAGARVDIDALRARVASATAVDANACYRRFASLGIEYGASHRLIETLSGDAQRALARLRAHGDDACAGEAADALPIGRLDAALQSVLGLALGDGGEGPSDAALPLGIGRLELYGPCADVVWVSVERARADGDVTLTLANADGLVRAAMRDITFAPKPPQHRAVPLVGAWRRARPAAPRASDAPHDAAPRWICLAGPLAAHAARVEQALSPARVAALPGDADEAGEHYASCVLTLVETLQAIARDHAAGARVDVVIPGDAAFHGHRGLASLLRTARQEMPRLRVALVECAAGAHAVVDALRAVQEHAEGEWQWREDGAWRRTWTPAELRGGGAPWRDGKLYWITGGAGALGMLLAAQIVEHAPAARIVLSGRSPLAGEAAETLRAWRERGVAIDYRELDVADRDAVVRTVREITARHGPLAGVVHAAGVRRDGLLIAKTREDVEAVLAPKVRGVLNIDAATRGQPLEFFVLFSSIAGALGNVGQADYAAANGFLDGFAQYRNARAARGERRGVTRAIGWPLWDAAGMTPDADTLAEIARAGLAPMPPSHGWRMLHAALDAPHDALAVLYGDARTIAARLAAAEMADAPDEAGAAGDAPAGGRGAGGGDAGLRAPVLARLKAMFADAFKMSPDDVLETAEFADYGIDSIVVLRMTRQLEKHFGPLSKTLLFEQRRLDDLADYFVRAYEAACAAWIGARADAARAGGARADHANGANGSADADAAAHAPGAVAAGSDAGAFDLRGRAAADGSAADGGDRMSGAIRASRECHESDEACARRAAASPDASPPRARPPHAATGARMNIAVVGLAGRYPKARDLDAFWANLAGGVDCIEEIPAERWDHARYYDSDRDATGKTYAKWGGFVDGVDEFDPLFFNISPKEASVMDPQERLFVQCAYEALEDAGYGRVALGGERPHGAERNIGVYVGVMYEEYPYFGVEHTLNGRPMALSGNPSSIANRVSYLLDLHGPSMAVDTMCSSSFTALHLACESLLSGQCRMAIAGGVNLSLHPNKFIALAQGGFAASDGRCRSFGEGGDGYVPSEGVGAVVLKPLAHALADGDHVYGLIQGIAINHGGKSNAYTVPNPDAQAGVIEAAYRRAGISPRDVSYLEAHGTGTALGDPIEIAGLVSAFRAFTDARQFCAIGSVKSTIGHCESAAGISALTKVLLQMKHGRLAPSLHARTPNPHIDFDASPFVLQRTLAPWPAPDGGTRIAGISSFGAGGTNAHVVVEEYRAAAAHAHDGAQAAASPAAVVLSARDDARLRALAQRLRDAVAAGRFAPHALHDLAFTLQSGRDHWERRIAMRVESFDELHAALDDFVAGRPVGARHWLGACRVGGASRRAPEPCASLDDAAAVWASGREVDWSPWRGARACRRVSAPTYPFARVRCRIPDAPASPAAPRDGAPSHPLLHRNRSTFGAYRFESHWRDSDPLVRDHRVQGRAVVPGVAQLELACAAFARLQPEGADAPRGVVRLADVAWVRPLVVAPHAHVRVDVAPPGETAHGGAASWRVHASAHGGDWQLCSQGDIRRVDAAAPAERADLAALRARCAGRAIDADTLYRAFASLGIEYGPAYRALVDVQVGEGGAFARLALPEAAASSLDTCAMPPSLLDAAFQAAAAFAIARAANGDAGEDGPAPLPFCADAVELHARCAARMWAHVRMRDGKRDAVDIDLYADSGERCVAVRNLVSRRATHVAAANMAAGIAAQPAGANAEVAFEGNVEADANAEVDIEANIEANAEAWRAPDATGDIVLAPVWEIVDAAAGTPFSPGIVVADDAAERARWAERCPHARIVGADAFAAREVAAALGAVDAFVWIAPRAARGGALADSPALDCAANCFEWIAALLAAGAANRAIDALFVTSGCRAIAADDPGDPAHAAIAGLVGALAKEHPRWRVRIADHASAEPAPVDALLRLSPDPQGDALAYRDGQWLRRRLLPVARETMGEPAAHRAGGVYLLIGGAGGLGVVYSEYLIRRYGAQVIWVGRRERDADIDAAVARLAALGPAPVYRRADAADPAALRAVCDDARARFGALHGVVHAAMVLADRSLARMTQQTLRAALVPKIDVARSMAAVLLPAADLDFMLFFSSMNAFTTQPGQGNYAAGCTFVDAFAHALRAQAACAVKVVDWGFWGSAGAVATPYFRARMAEAGIGSIEAPQAMRVLERLLAGPHGQLAMIHAIRPTMQDGARRWLAAAPEQAAAWRACAPAWPPAPAFDASAAAALDAALAGTLAARLAALGWPEQGLPRASCAARLGVAPAHAAWLDASIDILKRAGLASEAADGTVTLAAAAARPETNADAASGAPTSAPGTDGAHGQSAQLALLRTMTDALPDILRGAKRATDVMFASGSINQVESVYRGNAVSDYFNDVLAAALDAYLSHRARTAPGEPLRILEIGAGSGGTSARALECADRFAPQLVEYRYTDVSAGFLAHGRATFAEGRPYLAFAKFDVERDARAQGLEYGRYDVVIAANVLHATRDMQRTVASVKSLLKRDGLLLVNELSANTLFTHLTFGLLDGWWRFDDGFLRLPGGPALAGAQWRALLASAGFHSIAFPAADAAGHGQTIVCASSDGVVRLDAADATGADDADARGDASGAHELAAAPLAAHRDGGRGSVAAVADAEPDADTDADADARLRDAASAWLRARIGAALDIRADDIDSRETLERYGIDSITVLQLTKRLRDAFDDVPNTLLFEYNTVDALVDHWLATQPDALRAALAKDAGEAVAGAARDGRESGRAASDAASAHAVSGAACASVDGAYASGARCGDDIRIATDAGRATAPATVTTAAPIADSKADSKTDSTPPYPPHAREAEPVAVIGIAGRYPKAASLDAFWRNLRDGRDCIGPLPAPRGDWRSSGGAQGAPIGGFIDDIDRFDPLFFQISMREAQSMDPQERLFIEQAYACVEDAGYTPATLSATKRVGVYVGVMNGNYAGGTRYWSIANRVSYLFDLHGPSVAVDSACSSSLTAVHFALDALRGGSIDCALVGGVNLIVAPEHLARLSAMNMLSTRGKVSAFGADADGFVDGEGVGALLLKPLARAQADGDAIYGVLLGSAINAGGRTHGYTVPSPHAQADAVAGAYRAAGVEPHMLGYVEAHGTGTALGDPIEIRGLARAFERDAAMRGGCAIGSVKTNIGHAESAAGIAGLTKVLLQMRHRRLVPSLNADTPNPDIDFSRTPFRLQRRDEPWALPAHAAWPRIASVSSFGAGGANAVVVAREHVSDARVPRAGAASAQAIVVLSARDDDRLAARARQLLAFLRDAPDDGDTLARIAFTLQVGRVPMAARVAIVAGSLSELADRLDAFVAGDERAAGVHRGRPVPPGASVVHVAAAHATDAAARAVLARGVPDDIARYWADGGNPDWTALHAAHTPGRINLPAYPFAGERFWLSPAASGDAPARLAAAGAGANAAAAAAGTGEAFATAEAAADTDLADIDTDIDTAIEIAAADVFAELAAFAETGATRDDDLPSLAELFGEPDANADDADDDVDVAHLRDVAAQTLGVVPELIEPDAPLRDYGFDAVSLALFAQTLNATLRPRAGRRRVCAAQCATAGSLTELARQLRFAALH
ncbi:SDR family NAD(P)-dependent oxidoreductase [Burkholderia thailandensis]|uniref:SDR family NAD(P)-dependent oxidoreductase n=4 Tax=Burkholderia thailandensis TaxID=57975 RepID=UPI000D1E9B50|nr:SDR family NAD(P)-dependent oxidoreductase [Burkholderia thailandensis]AVR08006.1 polyketide synthase [Burkholderia thailandensis]